MRCVDDGVDEFSPVPPLPPKQGTHHCSEFHGERVIFPEVRMSAILKKKGLFLA